MAKRRNGAEHGVSAQRGARVVALELVDALGKAHANYVDGKPDALHDLRVAVRRLRSGIRAYRPVLDDTVSGKSRRALKALAEATAVARDAEVALGILDELPAPPPRTRSGHADLRRRLEREASDSRGDTDETLAAAIPKVVGRLTRELSHFQLDIPVDGDTESETMSEFSAHVVDRHGEKLARALEKLAEREEDGEDGDEAPDVDALHVARISGKRLRYVAERLPGTAAAHLVGRLTALQDDLGEYRDAQLLAERALADIARSARRDASARARALLAKNGEPPAVGRPARSRVRPGLLQVARGADARAREAWKRFEAAWPREGGAEQLRTEVQAVVDELSANRAGSRMGS
jgi:CHAD domain-containing protein